MKNLKIGYHVLPGADLHVHDGLVALGRAFVAPNASPAELKRRRADGDAAVKAGPAEPKAGGVFCLILWELVKNLNFLQTMPPMVPPLSAKLESDTPLLLLLPRDEPHESGGKFSSSQDDSIGMQKSRFLGSTRICRGKWFSSWWWWLLFMSSDGLPFFFFSLPPPPHFAAVTAAAK